MKINIAENLMDCPMGTKLYSPLCGECTLHEVVKDKIFIRTCSNERIVIFDEYGRYFNDSECLLFPSKDNRDWSKFKTKEPKFNPKDLKPFDKVLVRDDFSDQWIPNFYSYYNTTNDKYPIITIDGGLFSYAIPYNEETKHIVCTTEEAPEYYKYWED